MSMLSWREVKDPFLDCHELCTMAFYRKKGQDLGIQGDNCWLSEPSVSQNLSLIKLKRIGN
jgi:hypothetical protein